MITEGNKQKRQSHFLTLPLSSLHIPFHKVGVGCLLNLLPYQSSNHRFGWISLPRYRVEREHETVR